MLIGNRHIGQEADVLGLRSETDRDYAMRNYGVEAELQKRKQ